MNKKPTVKKDLLYRFKYSFAHLGGMNGRKLSNGATIYIFGLFLTQNPITISFNSEILIVFARYWHLIIHNFIAPSVTAFGAIFMLVGVLHKIYKFLFPKSLLGI